MLGSHQSRANEGNPAKRDEVDDEAVNSPALPHQAKNPKQALLVKLLSNDTNKVFQGGSKFFLEVCGSSGTGKTAALLGCLDGMLEPFSG